MQQIPILNLLRKEARLEFRNRSAFNALLLYVLASVFICFLSFKKIAEPAVWNALFWIILLFNAMNSAAKIFSNETRGHSLFNYTYYHPVNFILAKIIYNGILLIVSGTFTWFVYAIILGMPAMNTGMFFLVLILSSLALSGILTLVAGIAVKAGGNFTLMAILSFPLTLPVLLVAIRLSRMAIDQLAWSVSFNYFGALGALVLLTGGLAYLLFPYLWQD